MPKPWKRKAIQTFVQGKAPISAADITLQRRGLVLDSSPRVLIVVVNYETPVLTIRCAESLAQTLHQFPHAELVIVDNGSKDDSVELLSNRLATSEGLTAARERVRLLCLPENGGFAVGNNSAFRGALASASPPDYFWLLNSDTEVRPFALEALVTAMQANPRLGIAGSRLENQDETPQQSAFRFLTIAGEWEANLHWRWMTRILARSVMAPPISNCIVRVDWVAGASLFIRCAVLEQIGLLDEAFFMYFEDADYCYRATKAGWATEYIPTSRVLHRVGGTSKLNPTERTLQRMPRYWFAARQEYLLKHRGFWYTACANAAWLLGVGLYRVRQLVRDEPNTDPPHFWRDFLAYSIGIGGTRG